MNMEEMMFEIRKILPNSNAGFDNNGQIIIYTDLQMQDNDPAAYNLPLVEYSDEN